LTDTSHISVLSCEIARNTSGWSGGGIYSDRAASLDLSDTEFSSNYATDFGGAIFASETEIVSNKIVFASDTAFQGGAVFLEMCQDVLFNENEFIDNRAYFCGGGIFLLESDPTFQDCNISGNSAQFQGGGLYFADANPLFSASALNDVYLNHAGAEGNDFYSDNENLISVVLDTFTVAVPESYQVTPLALFDLTASYSKLTKVYADIHVNGATGDNSNDGLTEQTAVKTIFAALNKISLDTLTIRNIMLGDGIYSAATNKEFFPINMRGYTSISGNTEIGATLDAGRWAPVLHLHNDPHAGLKQLNITGGESDITGGIVVNNSSLNVQRCIITGNDGYSSGALKCENNSYTYLLNSTITRNNMMGLAETGGIEVSDSYLEIANSILWNNTGLEISVTSSDDTAKAALAYNTIEGDTTQIEADLQSLLFKLDGNISDDPNFTDALNGNFRPQEDSPCIDAGADSVFLVYNATRDTLTIPAIEFFGTAPDMGVFEYVDPSAISGADLIPDKFSLNQNYPNPFNPSTVISWQLAVGSEVELSIYNLLGQKVASLVAEKQKAGTHQVQWDASDFASGVYIYRLTTDQGFTKTKKLVLIK
jgi:predicted outer membrane repeat protein